MPKQYKFDFSNMTPADFWAGQQCASLDDFMVIMRRFYVGDFDALSMIEVASLVAPAFMEAFKKWTETISLADAMRLAKGVENDELGDIDDDALRAMLDDIDFGDS